MQRAINDLYSDFHKYFAVELVTSAEQRRLAAELRHRVFSEECGFEPLSADGQERDSYDKHSVQCLIRHRRSGVPASCIRLIFAGKGQHMALEDLCPDHIHMQYRDKMAHRRDQVCEVSRFAVHPVFRRTALSGHRTPPEPVIEGISEEERRCFAFLQSVALLSALAMADLYGQEYLFSLMEFPTTRLVRRKSGIDLNQAGESLEHFGRIAPFCVRVSEVAEQLRPSLGSVRDAVYATIAEDFQRANAAGNAVVG